MGQITWDYLAGFTDGEGTVTFSRQRDRHGLADPEFLRYADAVDQVLDGLRLYSPEVPVSKHAMVADITSPGRGVGFSDQADVDFLITREGRDWLVYESVVGEQRATGRTVAEALRRFAEELGLTGTIELCWETQGDRKETISI